MQTIKQKNQSGEQDEDQEMSPIIPLNQNNCDTQTQAKETQSCTSQTKWKNYRITHRLEKGYFGQIVLAELIQHEVQGITKKYAIKSQKLQIQNPKMPIQQENKRTAILKDLKSNFVVSIVQYFKDQQYVYQVMEWAEGGDCYSLIKQKSSRVQDFKKVGQCGVRFILGCIILGMEYLHSKDIIYRSLTPQNSLICSNGYVKLSNFNLAEPIKKEEKLSQLVGVILYASPQILLKAGYRVQADLWSIGILAYQMANYTPPFSIESLINANTIQQSVNQAQTNRIWSNHISQQLKDFINSLLKFDPKERLGYKSWDEIKEHQFFTCVNFDWKALEQMKLQSPLIPIINAHMLKYKAYVETKDKTLGKTQYTTSKTSP